MCGCVCEWVSVCVCVCEREKEVGFILEVGEGLMELVRSYFLLNKVSKVSSND